MKKSIISYLILIAALISLSTLWSCRKNRIEKLPPFTDLNVKVKDQNGKMLNGVNVIVFGSQEDFDNSIANEYNTDNALGIGIATDGQVLLDSLPSRNDYWILAYVGNSTLFPGFTIMFDNSEQTNRIPFRPSDKSIIDLSIVLRPAEGLVTFWSSSPNISSNQARIVSGENIAKNTANVSSSSLTAPAPNPTYTLKKRRGNYNYYGLATQFCTWTGNYIITPGQNINVELAPCVAGAVTIFSSQNASTLFPIEITLGQGAKKDTIFSPVVGNCGVNSLNVKTYNLPPGSYSYFAKSINPNAGANACVWSDRFVVTENNCLQINLPLCR
ncbi:MAG: hypothetical protein SNJ77_02735 [Cytophagales bacterium]